MVNQPVVLTLKEVAAYLRVHPTTVHRLVRRHELPAFKIGRSWRFNIEAINRWRLELGSGVMEFQPERVRAPLRLLKQGH